MGATRKLQGEIDRVLKKVQEGVDIFGSIWNKVYDTENANQKEKYEADLKKEIKKLQRYRDQIKTWIQSSEIKDKKVAASYEQALLDARKLIEREMERFKVCEKETKTKAFSKEGLGLQPKTDPREKAKGESRDWLNNMVSDLESQIDSFEAEMEGLSVKKGKSRPPRLTHLEESIGRHKQHIMKLEQILRLLDNDELSPEEVNEVREFVEDYVERNQDDFDEFSIVDDLYQSLPVEKMEALETADAAVPPVILGKEKVAGNVEEGALPEQVAEPVPEAAAPVSPTAQSVSSFSVPIPITPEASSAAPLNGTPVLSRSLTGLGSSPGSTIPSLKLPTTPIQMPAPVRVVSRPKEEEGNNLIGRRVGYSLSDVGFGRTSGPGPGPGPISLGMPSPVRAQLNLSGGASHMVGGSGSGGPAIAVTPDGPKRVGLGLEERPGSVPLSQQLGLTPNRILGQTGGKIGDGNSLREGGPLSEGATRVFSPPIGSTAQWRPQLQSPEPGQYGHTGRTEVAPDLKQKFLQRLQQVQQQNQSGAPLLNTGISSKQQAVLSSQPQSSFLQQTQLLHQQQQVPLVQPYQSGAVQQQQMPSVKSATPQLLSSSGAQAHAQQQLHLGQFAAQQPSEVSITVDEPPDNGRAMEQQAQTAEDNAVDTVAQKGAGYSGSISLIIDDDLKNHDTFDVSVGGPGSLGDFRELPRDTDFSLGGQMGPAQSSGGLGVIGGRRDNLGAIGDNLLSGANLAMHDQHYNKDALAAAYMDIPLPQDSERPKSYIPRSPAVAPSTYPQVPVPIIDNPALWEHLDTEILFFAFYFQQGTYQQYLAARELKKQSWRYHKKYNTWFQRHKEPKITTDEYEQGTYVYFDFHIVHDDHQQGWCQRIKTEFTFEYSYLEDELAV